MSNYKRIYLQGYNQKQYTDIHNSFNTVLKEANIDNFRFHDLRHTVATRLVEKGIDLVVVKEILGHSKIDTTLRYAHAVPKRKLEAIEVLNSYNQDFIHIIQWMYLNTRFGKKEQQV